MRTTAGENRIRLRKHARVRVRPYRPPDEPFLIRSLEAEQDHMIALDPFRDLRRTRGYGRAWARWTFRYVRRHRGRILIAEAGSGPVGFVSLAIRPMDELEKLESRPVRLGTIMDIFVVPGARGAGVGSALVRESERYLSRMGCDRVDLIVFAPNRRAHAWYRSLGYQEENVRLRKRIRGAARKSQGRDRSR